ASWFLGASCEAAFSNCPRWAFGLLRARQHLPDRSSCSRRAGVGCALRLLRKPDSMHRASIPDRHASRLRCRWLPERSEDRNGQTLRRNFVPSSGCACLEYSGSTRRRVASVRRAASQCHAPPCLCSYRTFGRAIRANKRLCQVYRSTYSHKFWGLWEEMHKETGRVLKDPHREGDGRVPLASALLENIGDIRYVNGIHGELPMLPPVYEHIFRWLK